MEDNKKLWVVRVEFVEHDHLYRTGMEIDDVVVAETKEDAIKEFIRIHSVKRESFRINSVNLYADW